jgi:hypothetical protein
MIKGHYFKELLLTTDASQCKNFRLLFLNVDRALDFKIVHKRCGK